MYNICDMLNAYPAYPVAKLIEKTWKPLQQP